MNSGYLTHCILEPRTVARYLEAVEDDLEETAPAYIPLTQAQISLCAKIGYMYYCEYAHLLKKHMEHTCMSAIYYDQGSDIKAKQCKTIVTFDTIPESKILDAGDLLILSNLQKPWTIACKDIEFLKLNILLIVYSIDQNYANAHSPLVTTY